MSKHLFVLLNDSLPISVQRQEEELLKYAKERDLIPLYKIHGTGDLLESVKKHCSISNAGGILAYRFDSLTNETLTNLGLTGDFFTKNNLVFEALTEDIRFNGGYDNIRPIIISNNRTSREERSNRVKKLQELFDSHVSSDAGSCGGCGDYACAYDQTQDGGSCVYYATLHFCIKCSWYRIDGEYWTTDY